MNGCWTIPKLLAGGGGNRASDDSITVRRSLALGDVLCATVVADRLDYLGMEVTFKAHPAAHCILRRIPSVSRIQTPNGTAHIDLDNSYESDPHRRMRHFHQMFFDSANRQLSSRGVLLGKPINCTPRLAIMDREKALSAEMLSRHPKPWVFICPRSNSYQCRTVPDAIWAEAAKLIPGTCFWIGMHPGPEGIVDLGLRHYDNVILNLSVADLLLTTDTGPLHTAAALRVPCVVLAQSSFPDWHLSDQNDFLSIYPEGDLKCLDCQLNACPKNRDLPPCQKFSPEKIASAARLKLENRGMISAAVSVYQPKAEVLNKCLQHLVDQVDEIVVVRDLAGIFPKPAFQHPKVKYLVKNQRDIGYGRKQNYAVRNTNGEFVLLVNDDVFLEHDAVARMVQLFDDPRVGMSSNLLRYPDRTIYHAGKIRSPGARGWGHIDHRKFEPTIKVPTEMENVCGACITVRREAFYSVNGFDERFYLYAEDDDMSLAFRHKGWKIMFTPLSVGVHLEHQSTQKTPKIMDIVHESNRMFGEKWSGYFEWNAQRVPGNFAYLS